MRPRVLIAAALAAGAVFTAAACGSSGDTPLPAGMSENDRAIGEVIVAGVADVWPAMDANDHDAFHAAALAAADRARPYREQGDHPCIRTANSLWWLAVAAAGPLAELETGAGRDALIRRGAANARDAIRAVDACPQDVRDAIGWDTTPQ